MRSFKEIKERYRFTEEDRRRLQELRPLMTSYVDEVMDSLSSWIMSDREASRFFTDETKKKHIFSSQKTWFLDLFSGIYDHRYFERLIRIGSVHVKSNVDAHFMNRSINIIRNTCINMILNRIEEPPEEKTKKIISFEKILDINLDVITSAYIEEEIKTYSPVYKLKSTLVDFAEKFSQSMNLILILALIGLTLGVILLFVNDLKGLLHGELYHGIISSLGSLLILWVMIELMNTEISHLKGGKFHISIFIGVALVTLIRETMIATLKHERPETIYYLIAAILVIGFIYWLVVKAEEKKR
ncbi:MAG: protoglobin domain-containing protein [Thermodesulfovibrionales bacterium]|nr:protoglobin domain-containing protein [Thermodesulfovibrionales bacterium]